MFSLIPWRKERGEGALTRRDPFELMHREFQSLFDRIFGGWSDDWRPAWGIDLNETDKDVVVRIELPGFEASELDVQLNGNVLTVQAERKKVEGEAKEEQGLYGYAKVSRSVTLPEGLDFQKAEASYKNGVLEIRLPRTPEAQPRKIEVKA